MDDNRMKHRIVFELIRLSPFGCQSTADRSKPLPLSIAANDVGVHDGKTVC